MPSTIPVSVAELRRIRWLVEKSSRLIHSDGRMVNDDKRAVLGPLAEVKRTIDKFLQLELFSADQLER